MNVAAAVLVHLAGATFCAMLLGLTAGRITPAIAAVSLSTGILAGIAAVRMLPAQRDPATPQRRSAHISVCGIDLSYGSLAVVAMVLLAALQHFLFLLSYRHGEILTLHPNNAGDLSLHIQYIRSMASGAHFWPQNPGFAGGPLRYPLGMDLYNALWEALGVPLDGHLFATGVVMTCAAVALLYAWMGAWGIAAFFLNGGLANWRSIWELQLYDYQNAATWKNFLVSVWVPQRGFLFALPAGVWLLSVVTGAFVSGRKLEKSEKIVAAVLWAALAWFHLHTFMVITLAIALLSLRYGRLHDIAAVALPAALAGGVFVGFSTNLFSTASVLRIQWGWVAGKQSHLSFWIDNLGFWIPLSLWAVVLLVKDRAYLSLRPVAETAFLLFFLFTFVMAAPWDWDNIKVLLWGYLLIAFVISRTVLQSLSPGGVALVAILAFAPGAVSVLASLPGTAAGVRLYNDSEIAEAEAALHALPADAVLAAAPEPNHPAMFLGKKMVMGYPGHLWSHGIDYRTRQKQLETIFRGGDSWRDAARSSGATHIYWGRQEREKYAGQDPEWQHCLKNVSESQSIAVYEIE